MSRSSPWPTNWRGSPERCCSAGNRLTPTRYPWSRRDSFGRSESAGRASGVCERVKTRWPDSQSALRKPGVENGARRRRVYEDRGARISILAGRRPPRPDTLKQTDQPPISTKPLADGAGHTFSTQFVVSEPRRCLWPWLRERHQADLQYGPRVQVAAEPCRQLRVDRFPHTSSFDHLLIEQIPQQFGFAQPPRLGRQPSSLSSVVSRLSAASISLGKSHATSRSGTEVGVGYRSEKSLTG